MQTESIGTLLPKVVLPYLGQWAEHSGLDVLSKLLVDDQFLALVARYGDQLMPPPAPRPEGSHSNRKPSINGHRSQRPSHGYGSQQRPQHNNASDTASHEGNGRAESENAGLANLHARVLAMEGQLKAQQALFELLRSKIRPLAQALGCCPECLVGLEQCPRCFGASKVAYFEPDTDLFRTLIAGPLMARGVPVTLGDRPEVPSDRRSQDRSTTKKRKSKQ